MVGNVPLKSITHGGYTIEGYSRAAVQSYWRVPELNVGFDLGAHPWDFTGTPNWFISHGHLDHIAALPVYIARRRMMKMSPPNIYMPEEILPNVEKMLGAVSRVDRGRLPCDLRPMEVGDEVSLSQEAVVTAVRTTHTVSSLGYIVWQRRNKLKAEYIGLSGPEICQLKNKGVEITKEIRVPLIAYTGDTSPVGVDRNPELFQAKILLLEMTFLAEEHSNDNLDKRGHMHLQDFVDRKDKFKNEVIIATHFSTRYGRRQVQSLVRKALPDMLGDRLHLWI
ncbi:MAG: MBL fold metallo-hydrolase [Pirellulaceae bacterium]|nr:MBL fold metallo-hydrolase [Pirellulaceae bacterium]